MAVDLALFIIEKAADDLRKRSGVTLGGSFLRNYCSPERRVANHERRRNFLKTSFADSNYLANPPG